MFSLGRDMRERSESTVTPEQNFHYLGQGKFSEKQLWGIRSGAQLRV